MPGFSTKCEALREWFAVASGELSVVVSPLGYFLYTHTQYKSPREIYLLFEVKQFIKIQTQQ